MDVNKENDFDNIAPYYSFLSKVVFGNKLLEAQCYFLDRIPTEGNVLILGGGDGTFLKRLMAYRPKVRVVYVERSVKMIQLAKKKTASDSVTWVNGSWSDLSSGVTFDVVITNFFFDLFTQEECLEIIQKVSRQVAHQSIWMVTEFMQPKRWWDKVILWVMFKFFKMFSGMRVQALSDWNICFKKSYKEEERKYFRNEFIVNAVFRFNAQQHRLLDT